MREKLTPRDFTKFHENVGQWIDFSSLVDWVGNFLEPQQVFDKADLANWAADNGWTKED